MPYVESYVMPVIAARFGTAPADGKRLIRGGSCRCHF